MSNNFTYSLVRDEFTHDTAGFTMTGEFLCLMSNDIIKAVAKEYGVELTDAEIEMMRTL